MNYRKIGLYTTLISSLAFQAHSQCFYKSDDNLAFVGHIESEELDKITVKGKKELITIYQPK